MSLYRTDPAIGAWLAEGPTTLSASAVADVKATVRCTRQRSVVMLSLPNLRPSPAWRLVLVAATVASLVAGLTLVAGMLPPTETDADPSATSPTATAATSIDPSVVPPTTPVDGLIRGAGRTLQLHWSFPEGVAYERGAVFPEYGGAGQTGYFFTFDGKGQYDEAEPDDGEVGPFSTPRQDTARGIVVADVDGATGGPYSGGIVLGAIDAGTFWSRVASNPRFTVGEITPTDFGGTTALQADVSGGSLEQVPRMDFSLPSRLMVANIGGGIIAVQLWAATSEALGPWVREATSLLETFEFSDPPFAACWEHPGTPVELDRVARGGRFTLDGTNVTVDYELPLGFDFSTAETQPGVIGFAQGPRSSADVDATGLSYGFLDGEVLVWRGLVVGEATLASRHSGGGTNAPAFGTDRRTFFEGLQGESHLRVENVRDTLGPGGTIARTGLVTLVNGPSAGAWPHIDRVGSQGRGCLVDFTRPSQLSVVDVDGTLIVFQAWATGRTELAVWLPIAEEIIREMTIVEARR